MILLNLIETTTIIIIIGLETCISCSDELAYLDITILAKKDMVDFRFKD